MGTNWSVSHYVKTEHLRKAPLCSGIGSWSQLVDYINTQDTFVHYYVMMVNTGDAPVLLSSASYTCDSTCETYFKIGCVYLASHWFKLQKG